MMTNIIIAFLLYIISISAYGLEPPRAPVQAWSDTIHGHRRTDDYHWLRDRDDPEVLKYLKAENAYTDSMMGPTRPIQRRLYREILSRIQETDLSVPVAVDSFLYYSRTVKGKDYSIYCRKKTGPRAREEVLLNENLLAQGHRYYSIEGTFISPDHRILAYIEDTSGSYISTLRFKDLASGSLLDDSVTSTEQMAWANDSRTVYYSQLDSAQRSFQIWRHLLGSDPGRDALVYQETDPAYIVGVQRSKSRRYMFITTYSKDESEVHYASADSAAPGFKLFAPRREGVEYYLNEHSGNFYILTNDSVENFRVLATPTGAIERTNWQEIIPHRPEVLIEEVLIYRDYLVILERRDGLQTVRVRRWDTGQERQLSFPEPTYAIYPWYSYDFNTSRLRYSYSSLVTPTSVYEYDLADGSQHLLKREKVRGGYHAECYQSERLYATTPDGARVPISLVYRTDLRRPAGNPCYLHGYGAYGTSVDPWFSSSRLSLLDRGFVYVIAHVRGGQEMGRRWYQQGKLLNKKNTFTDFIACAEHLFANGFTTPGQLVISGGSSGGLLVGAVVTMQPDICQAAVMDVPFVDVINTMLDPSIPLTTIEYDEWGDPRDRAVYDYIASYAPYENISPRRYPAMLVTSGLNDANVPYWEPAKWVAKLRAMKADSNLLLLKTDLTSGHGGPSGRYQYLKDTAFEYAFVLKALGIYK